MSMTTDGGATWVPDVGVDNPSIFGLDIKRISYPAPTVAYAVMSAFLTTTARIWKASINLVEVKSIEPNPACAGAVVTITGSGFSKDSTVSFGTTQVPSTDVQHVSGTELKVKVPPRSLLDTVDVTVTTPQLGTSIANPGSRFTYKGPVVDAATGKVNAPTVKSVTPPEGKVAGARGS